MKAVTEKRWFYVLLSVVVAVVFWGVVRFDNDPVLDNRVSDIPVTITGTRVLENQGLKIQSQSDTTVSLVWKGKWDDIGKLNRNTVSVTLDVSRISEPGVHELLYNINYPVSVTPSDFSVQRMEPESITVTVAKVHSKSVTIQPVFKGSVANGYQAGEFIVEPETVLVSGAEDAVDRVKQAQVVVSQKDMKASFSGELPILLLDEQGKELVPEQEGLTLSVTQPYVVLPILVTKELPLALDFIAGGGASQNKHIDYKIFPETITVSGTEEDMQSLTEISLGSIDLAQVLESYVGEYPIYLPSGIENVSGITKASVEITVKGLYTRTFEVQNIELQNTPKGYDAVLSTQVCTITLRGPKSSLDAVQPSQIKLVADLSELDATGSYNVPVKVYLYTSGDVGAIGTNSVVVKLSK